MTTAQVAVPLAFAAVRRAAAGTRLVLISPPALEGRTNERTYSGGIGVSRKLKPFETEGPQILPIDFLYMAGAAEQAGAEVTLVDLLIDRHQGTAAERFCLEKIGSSRGANVWIGVRLSMPSLLKDLAFADRMKALMPECRVFVFGTAIMATIDHWIKKTTVDYVLFGEAEAFLDKVITAADPAAVSGVISPKTWVAFEGPDLYDRDKNVPRYDDWVKAGDLTALPRPAWHLLDMTRYTASGRPSDVGVYVQASRGCPIGCSMCPYMLLEGLPWRKNEVEGVVDEIEYLNKAFGIYRVRFRDPNFGFKREHARALAEALIARGVRLEATVETSLEIYDEPTLRKLYAAGILTITTGVETNDEACMESIGQKIKINAKIRDRVAMCHKIGFHVYGTYCLGMPEETWQTVEKTWRFANELDIESGFTILSPFPGTPLYWRAIEEGLVKREMRFSDWNSYTATVRTYALTTRDLDIARWWARMETIIPYRRKRAAEAGITSLARFYWQHLPHFALRQFCRTYVWFRKRMPPAVALATSASRQAQPSQ